MAPSNPALPKGPVFHDPAGRRWPRLRGGLYVLAAFAAAVLILAVASILSNPFLPRIKLRPVKGLPLRTNLRLGPAPKAPPAVPRAVQKVVEILRREETHAHTPPGRRPQLMKVAPAPAVPPSAKASAGVSGAPIVAGFYVNWDDSSYASLRRNLSRLDWVIPEWARLESEVGKRQKTGPLAVTIDPRALDLVHREKPSARILPLVQNFHDGGWDGPLVATLLGDPASRAKLVASLVELVATSGFSGAVIDFEEVPPETQPALLAFLGDLKAQLATTKGGGLLGEAVPFDDEDWNYKAHAAVTDQLFLMAYDEHWSTSGPGPVAGQAWYAQHLATRLGELDPAHVIVCIGGYGYNWDAGEKEAVVVSFAEAMRAARDAEVDVVFDRASRNPSVRYEDESGSQHQVWFLDAATAWNEIRVAERAHVAGFALWRLGVEDPSLWSVLGTPHREGGELPSRIDFPYDVDFDGTGEILQAVSTPKQGERVTTMDAGLVAGERYTALPSSYVIKRTGDRNDLVALTFDDGPDATYTPAILDILRRENVRASFFVIGEKGAEHPELVRRVLAEGHDLGNHTYTHPNLGEASSRVIDLELNATQRLFESLTGHGTALFRAPYFGDAEPQTPDEVTPIFRAQALGYIAVGLRVDPDDWALPGSAEIVRRTLAQAGNTDVDDDARGGHIVLLHDGGGVREQTVEALPAIIKGLRDKGMKLVPVSELAGLTRDQAMPPVAQNERIYSYSGSVLVYAFAAATWFLRWLFALGLLLGLARILFVTVLALIQHARTRRLPARTGPARRISILVPAYNEEKVIARTIESLLASTWPDFEIIVIDDGSKDGTWKLLCERFESEPHVRIFTKPNGGKAQALAFGLAHATGDVVVALDADTIFPPDVLAELVAPFSDPRVGAVAGNAKVGNRINLITRWQALEYIASQNLDRRAFALLDCITVVPGAVGAWRRDVLEELGGFHSDTLAEDQDLTLKVRMRGYRIAYAERAVAWTEAPDTVRALAKQRFRWSFGTLQCMWKHRRGLFRFGTLGWVAMPNVWVFQILFPLFAPVVDLLLVGALAWATLERIEHPAVEAFEQLEPVLFYYAFFLVTDWIAAAVAFLMEKEQKSLLFWFLLQRVAYRQVMYWVMLKSVAAAFRGGIVGWGKLERKASVVAR